MNKEDVDEVLKRKMGTYSYCCRDTMAFIIESAVQHDREEQEPKMKEIKADTEKRKEIHLRIKKLKQLGFPKEEALKRIAREYADSEYIGFFESWINNAYKISKNQIENKKNTIEQSEIDNWLSR